MKLHSTDANQQIWNPEIVYKNKNRILEKNNGKKQDMQYSTWHSLED